MIFKIGDEVSADLNIINIFDGKPCHGDESSLNPNVLRLRELCDKYNADLGAVAAGTSLPFSIINLWFTEVSHPSLTNSILDKLEEFLIYTDKARVRNLLCRIFHESEEYLNNFLDGCSSEDLSYCDEQIVSFKREFINTLNMIDLILKQKFPSHKSRDVTTLKEALKSLFTVELKEVE